MPDWLAIALGFGSGLALATGTAWAGLCSIRHHHKPQTRTYPTRRFGWGVRNVSSPPCSMRLGHAAISDFCCGMAGLPRAPSLTNHARLRRFSANLRNKPKSGRLISEAALPLLSVSLLRRARTAVGSRSAGRCWCEEPAAIAARTPRTFSGGTAVPRGVAAVHPPESSPRLLLPLPSMTVPAGPRPRPAIAVESRSAGRCCCCCCCCCYCEELAMVARFERRRRRRGGRALRRGVTACRRRLESRQLPRRRRSWPGTTTRLGSRPRAALPPPPPPEESPGHQQGRIPGQPRRSIAVESRSAHPRAPPRRGAPIAVLARPRRRRSRPTRRDLGDPRRRTPPSPGPCSCCSIGVESRP